MKKTILTVIMAACLALLWKPMAANATATVYVGGVQLTAEKPYVWTGFDKADTKKPADGGYAYFDSGNSTLVLHDFSYTGEGFQNAAISITGISTITLEGENTVLQNDLEIAGHKYGLYCGDTEGSLTITGTGTLIVAAGNCNFVSEIYSYGIYTQNEVNITSSATVMCYGGKLTYRSHGLYCESYTGTGTLIATGGASVAESYGIYAEKQFNPQGGVIIARSDSDYNDDCPTAYYENQSKKRYAVAVKEEGTLTWNTNQLKIAGAVQNYMNNGTSALQSNTKVILADYYGKKQKAFGIVEGTQIPATAIAIVPKGYTVSNEAKTVTANMVIDKDTIIVTDSPNAYSITGSNVSTLNVQQGKKLIAVSFAEGNQDTSGIYVNGAEGFKISGDILAIGGMCSKNNGYSAGIYSKVNKIEINGGKVFAAGGGVAYGTSYGIHNCSTIGGEADVTAVSGSTRYESIGLSAIEQIEGSASVHGIGLTCSAGDYTNSYGIKTEGPMTILSDRNIVAISGFGNNCSCGLYSYNYLYFLGSGRVTVLAGLTKNERYGLVAMEYTQSGNGVMYISCRNGIDNDKLVSAEMYNINLISGRLVIIAKNGKAICGMEETNLEFSNEKQSNSEWYAWRQSETSSYTDSTQKALTWSDLTSPYLEIIPKTYGITLSESGTVEFTAAKYGYDAQTAKSITVTNSETGATGTLSVTLSGANKDSFTVNKTSLNSIAAGKTVTFTVAPKTGLAAGTHTATVTVKGANVAAKSFNVSFQVQPIYVITLNKSGTQTFPEATEGYGTQTPISVSVKNEGSQETGTLSVALSGTNKDSFTLSKTSLSSIAFGKSSSFTVVPKTGLKAGTYQASVMVSGIAKSKAKFTSGSVTFRFTVKPSYGVKLSQSGTYAFPSAVKGYADRDQYKITVSNTGTASTGALTVALSGTNKDSFTVSKSTITSIAKGSASSFTIVPKTGLAAGTYTAKVTVKNSLVSAKSFSFSFHVYAKETAHADDNQDGFCDMCGVNILESKKLEFVKRMYRCAFEREPEQEGLTYWSTNLNNGSLTGSQMASYFIISDEMKNRNLDDTAFLNVMYAAFFNRQPDTEGFAFWSNLMDNGMSRKYVLSQFVKAAEYVRLCEDCAILMGEYTSDEPRDVNISQTAYLTRCYTKALGRRYDEDGLNYWSTMISSGAISPKDVAIGFVVSPEFTEKNLSDDEYIKVLYRTFFGREADGDGYNYWMTQLQSGAVNREGALQFFANSDEFKEITKSFGL